MEWRGEQRRGQEKRAKQKATRSLQKATRTQTIQTIQSKGQQMQHKLTLFFLMSDVVARPKDTTPKVQSKQYCHTHCMNHNGKRKNHWKSQTKPQFRTHDEENGKTSLAKKMHVDTFSDRNEKVRPASDRGPKP